MWAERLFVAGGEGNVELAVQDLKLLVRERLQSLEPDPAPGQPRALPPLAASLEAHAILDDLDRLGAATPLEDGFRMIERAGAFLDRWPPRS